MEEALNQLCPLPLAQLESVSAAAMGELDYIRSQVKCGKFEFFKLCGCYFVTTKENTASGAELVIVCAQGENLRAATAALYPIAKAAGYKTARIHAFRRGMRRLLSSLDFKQAETVYRLTF